MADGALSLDVRCFDEIAGRLVDESGGISFAYDPGWLSAGMPPLSQSLPLDGVVRLRGGRARSSAACCPKVRRASCSLGGSGSAAGNDFGLLAAVGGDTAGAISLQPPGQAPSASVNDVRVA